MNRINFDQIQRDFNAQGFMHLLGATLESAGSGECVIRLPFRSELSQQHGFFHAGVTASLADNAAGFAGFSLMNDQQQPLSAEFKINLLAPAVGEALIARARVLQNGFKIKHVQVEVFATQGNEETLVAIALATIAATSKVTSPSQ